MTIIICMTNLFPQKVGLAVGDIDSVRRNATLQRMAMQVAFVAEVGNKYPRMITRRIYKPSIEIKPNVRQNKFRYALFLNVVSMNSSSFWEAGPGQRRQLRGLFKFWQTTHFAINRVLLRSRVRRAFLGRLGKLRDKTRLIKQRGVFLTSRSDDDDGTKPLFD